MLWDEPKIFFLERRYFFSIILSEFLKNRVALHRDDLKRKRAQSVRNVKATNGLISLEKRARSAGEPDWDGDEWQD